MALTTYQRRAYRNYEKELPYFGSNKAIKIAIADLKQLDETDI